jgi:hypothetical protein
MSAVLCALTSQWRARSLGCSGMMALTDLPNKCSPTHICISMVGVSTSVFRDDGVSLTTVLRNTEAPVIS